MSETNVKLETSIRNSGFSTLLCSALGFVLLEAGTVRLGGKPIAHAIIVSIGAILACIIYRAIVPYYATAAMQSNKAVRDKHGKLPSSTNLICAALLVMFGYAGAMALSSGLMTIFAVFAGFAYIFPWSKIALCRTHIRISVALVTLAMGLGLLVADHLPHPLLFLVAVWMLWMAAVWAWLMNIFYRQREAKASRLAAPRHVEEPADAVQA